MFFVIIVLYFLSHINFGWNSQKQVLRWKNSLFKEKNAHKTRETCILSKFKALKMHILIVYMMHESSRGWSGSEDSREKREWVIWPQDHSLAVVGSKVGIEAPGCTNEPLIKRLPCKVLRRSGIMASVKLEMDRTSSEEAESLHWYSHQLLLLILIPVNIFWFLVYSVTVNWIYVDCWQNKTFDDAIWGFGKLWSPFVTIFWHFIDQTTFY